MQAVAVNDRHLTDADVQAVVAALVEAFDAEPVKSLPVKSAMRIGLEVGFLLAEDPLLKANEADARVRGRREVVHEAVRIGKAILLGPRRRGRNVADDRTRSSDPDAGSERYRGGLTDASDDASDPTDEGTP